MGAAVEGRVGVIDDAEKARHGVAQQAVEQLRILAFGQLEVMPAGADDAKIGSSGASISRIDALRCQPSDEEDAAAEGVRGG